MARLVRMRKGLLRAGAVALACAAAVPALADLAAPGYGEVYGTARQGEGARPSDLRLYDVGGRRMVVDDRAVLGLIGRYEARDNYDIVTSYTRLAPPRPLTQMTIRDVLAFQDKVVANGSNSSAMGMYQFIRGTLRSTAMDSGLGLDSVFDRFNQDRLARHALSRCGFYRHDVADTDIGNCLARVWASLPVVAGPGKGRSYYAGYNGNAHLTSVESVMATIRGRFKDATPQLLAWLTRQPGWGAAQAGATQVASAAKAPPSADIFALPGSVPTVIQGGMMPPPAGMPPMAMAPGYMPAAPSMALLPQPSRPASPSPAEIERRRQILRALYGENAGLGAERIARP